MIQETNESIFRWPFCADVKEVPLRIEAKSPMARRLIPRPSPSKSAGEVDSTEHQSFFSWLPADPQKLAQYFASIYNGEVALAIAGRFRVFPGFGGCLPSLIIEAQVDDASALQSVPPYLQAEFFW